ncbi:MAG: HAD family phosphatase [Oscillospiraceae bacterium]|nr:HAD family phosphatase [Oscillospiraceae bacterium]
MCNSRIKTIKTNPVKAVFFDLDGTVLDTESLYIHALEQALEQLGIKNEVNYPARCIGISGTEMKKLFLCEIGSEQEYEQTLKIAWQLAEKTIKEQGVKVKNGFFELIEELNKIGAKAYIVSSTKREFALDKLKITGIYDYFEAFVCGGDYQNSKPDPEPYLTALKLSGESANNCIAVEDSAAGLMSATSAGLKCVLIRDLAEIPPETAELAFIELKSLKDVIDLIL